MRRCLPLTLLLVPFYWAQTTIDLSITAFNTAAIVTDTQTLAVSGSLAVTVANTGTSPATSFTVRVFEDRNNNGVYDGSDQQLGSSNVASLAATSTTNINVALSGNLLFAGNILHAQADAQNAVSESNENNNYRHTGQSSTFTTAGGALDTVVNWQKTNFAQAPNSVFVGNTPAVGDLDGDTIPEIVFTTFTVNEASGGLLRALDGRQGAEKFSVTDPAYALHPGAGITLADIDGDNRPEILAADEACHVIAFEHDGAFKWRSSVAIPKPTQLHCWVSISVADLDRNGSLEIVAGRSVFNTSGGLVWTGAGAHYGGSLGAQSVVADIDLDGNLEVVAGAVAYRANGSIYWNRSADFADAFVAIANIDNDPQAEIVFKPRLGFDTVALEHDGTTKWTSPWMVSAAGAPTIGNFDADPEVEIGIAGWSDYRVYEANGAVKYSLPIFDNSSGMTSASLFDFNNDGSAEVVFGDQTQFYIWRGSDGAELFKVTRYNSTAVEMPIVADVDADGHADIVVGRTNYLASFNQGIVVYRGANNNWANTRRIWSQPSYSITHVLDNLTVPTSFTPNWLTPGLNNFRLNTFIPGTESPNSASDLTISYLRRSDADFPAKTLLTARVGNGGAAPASSAGVRFTLGSGGPTLCETTTSVSLAPGLYQDVACEWLMPVAGTQNIVAVVDPTAMISEGNETNNTAGASLVIGQGPLLTIDDTTVRSRDAAIDLKWTPQSGAASYNIYRRTATGSYALHRAAYVNALGTFADTGLSNNSVYWYNVRWLNAQGVESPLGMEGSAMPIARTQRNDTAPTILSTPTTRGRVSQQWSYLPNVADPDAGDTKVFALVSAPSGLTINPTTGQMLFTPGTNQSGLHRILWSVTDSRNRVTSQGFNLFVETQVINAAPVITSSAITNANVGRNYAYGLRATDPDSGDLLSYSLDAAPSGLTIHPSTGLISWIPSAGQLGTHNVTARARDLAGLSATQSFAINVVNSNRQPTITSTPPTSVLVNNTYSYSPVATDPDGDLLSWAIVSGPAGATIQTASGLLLFTPTVTGPVNFTIRASDPVGGNASQSFTVQVNAIANANPAFTSSAPTNADVNGTYRYQATASDPDNNPIAFSLVSGPAGMTVSSTGLVEWTPTATGNANVVIRVQDNNGGFATQSFTIIVGAEDTTPPVITFASPAPNASIATDTTVTGSITDANLVSWRVEYQVPGAPTWTLLGSGTAPVNNGILGVLPASRLADNPYHFRVSAFDRRQGYAGILPLRVQGGQVRLGAFTLTSIDMRVPALQMPIEIKRDYDSTKPHSNDFGTGWALGFSNFDLRVDAAFNAFINLPNGRRVAFQFTPTQDNPLFPTLTNNYNPPSGVYDKLENLDCPQFLGGSSGLVCLGGSMAFQPYAPRNWRFTTKDGIVYTIRDSAVTRIEDRNANWTNIALTGITTSLNRNVTFTRDSAGRITQITDARGKRLLYTYDSLGRLTSVLDSENRQTTYAYQGDTHLITQITSANGCQAVRQEYDLNGRLTARIDASGNRTEFSYDTVNRRTTTNYPGGVSTVQTFDASGNLVSFTDGRGLVWNFTYDAGGRRLSMQTPTGRLVQRTYDANGNPISESFGPNGGPFQTTTFNYTAGNLLERVNRTNGDYQTYTYDANANLTAFHIYNAANTLIEERLYTYDATGRLLKSTDAQGVFNYAYDSYGNPIQRTDASLRGETITYDTNGNPVAYFNGLGQRLDADYDGYGNRNAYRIASLIFATATYNEYSLPTSLINGLGHTYTYTYDCAPALTRVTDPALQQTNYTRDAFSNMTQQSDVLTRLTSYNYNGNGNETLMTSPAGDSLSTAYNPENLISSLNNGGGVVNYAYDVYSRLQTETLPTATITYNRDQRGRATSIVTTGANAGTHTNVYDAANRIVSNTDKFGRSVSYAYDIRGRRTSLTDHNGVVTNYTYDAGGKVQRIQTGADFAEFTYDAAGRRTQLLYSNGVRANYTYDSRNRLLTHTWLSPTSTVIRSWAFTYDAASRPTLVTLNDGSITRAFDSLGRLTSENIASTLWGNHNFSWTYDAAGNRLDTGTTFGNDHRQLSHDGTNFNYTAAGNQQNAGAYALAYDAYNRMTSVGYTNFTFDHLGRRNSALFFDGREVSFDGENTLAIYSGVNTYRFTHSLTLDDLLFVQNHGATRFYITDHQGTVVGLTDAAGALTAQFGYNAWGQFVYRSVFNIALGSAAWNPFFFQGRELETFLNLYHLRAREYSAIRGRFLQKDPERGNELLPLSRHPYLFALNRPTSFVDPMGREAEVYAALITQNPAAKGGGFAAGFSIGFSGTTLSFIGHFLGEFLKDPTADVTVTMQNAADMAVAEITKVVEDWEKRIGKKKKKTTSVGEGLSEGAPEGISTFSSYIQGVIN